MEATRATRGRSAIGTRTTALVLLLLLCTSAVVTACGAADTTSSSPSPSEVAASVAPSPSTTPLPRGAGRGTIAFTRVVWAREGSTVPPFDIYVVRTDGSGLRRLASGARGPAWSPDGTRIAYTSCAARGGVWVMNADGSGKRCVTPAPGGAEWVAWSPDGKHILFTSTAFGGADTLMVVGSDGSGLRCVFADAPPRSMAGYSPAWAPDGRVFFGRGSGSLGEICSVDPDGRRLTVVTATKVPASFSLSRDGKWLAIWDGDSDRLLRMTTSGRGLAVTLVEEVSQYLRGGGLSSWSPNGGQLVFGRDSRAWLVRGAVLHVAKAGGSVVWEVPNTEDAYDPAWRPE